MPNCLVGNFLIIVGTRQDTKKCRQKKYTKMVVLFRYNEVKIMIKYIILVHFRIIFLDDFMVFNAVIYEILSKN